MTSEEALPIKGHPSVSHHNWVDIGGEQCIKLDDEIVSLEGTWELAMIRSEKLSVEKMYQRLIGGEDVALEDECEGAFVENEFGIFQLQERIHLDLQEYLSTDLENIKQLIEYNKIDGETANKLLNQNKKNREIYLNKVIEDNPSDGYYPANLPDGIDFVVSTQALIDFIVEQSKDSEEPPINRRTEATYQNIIGAFLDFVSGEAPHIDKHPNFTSEAKLIEYFGEYEIPGLAKSTLEMKFAEAKKTFRSNS